MNPRVSRNVNLFAAALFVFGGLICAGLEVYLTVKPADSKESQYIKPQPDKLGCVKALQELGFETKKPSAYIVAGHSHNLDESPKELVDRASLGIAACKVPMRTFCMGEECAEPGISFTLDFSDGVSKPVAAK